MSTNLLLWALSCNVKSSSGPVEYGFYQLILRKRRQVWTQSDPKRDLNFDTALQIETQSRKLVLVLFVKFWTVFIKGIAADPTTIIAFSIEYGRTLKICIYRFKISKPL